MTRAALPALSFQLSRRVRNLLEGMHISWRLGEGDRFVDLKPYEHGDPLRRIDWRYAGRTDRLAVRRFEQSRQIRLVVLYDLSPSVTTSVAEGGRRERLEEIVSALRWIGHANADRTEVIGFHWDHLSPVLSALDKRRFDLLIILSDFWEPLQRVQPLWHFCRVHAGRWETRALGLLLEGEHRQIPPLATRLFDQDHRQSAYLGDSDQQNIMARRIYGHLNEVGTSAARCYIRFGWDDREDPLGSLLFLTDPSRYPLAAPAV